VFRLKLYDMPLANFDISDDPLEGQKAVFTWVNPGHEQLLPIGVRQNDTESLTQWLRSRVIPRNREFVQSFLAKNGLNPGDTRGILQICRGLSLNDSYWVTEDGFDGKFADYNLYEHSFLTALSLIAYTGYGSARAQGFSSSPEFTTGGMLRKGWRRLNGRILLYKGGTSGAANTGREPYSEYYASQIAERMGLPHVDYGLSFWKHNLCSTCELFTDINHSYVPIYRFFEKPTLRSVADYLKQLGTEYYNAFADMLIFDALICNEDRHFGNFGLLVDSHTNQPVSFAPIFDNGLSLFNYAMEDDLQDTAAYARTRLSAYQVPFNNIVREFITARQAEQLQRMIGFRFERHPRYNLPAARLKALEHYLSERVTELLSV